MAQGDGPKKPLEDVKNYTLLVIKGKSNNEFLKSLYKKIEIVLHLKGLGAGSISFVREYQANSLVRTLSARERGSMVQSKSIRREPHVVQSKPDQETIAEVDHQLKVSVSNGMR